MKKTEGQGTGQKAKASYEGTMTGNRNIWRKGIDGLSTDEAFVTWDDVCAYSSNVG